MTVTVAVVGAGVIIDIVEPCVLHKYLLFRPCNDGGGFSASVAIIDNW